VIPYFENYTTVIYTRRGVATVVSTKGSRTALEAEFGIHFIRSIEILFFRHNLEWKSGHWRVLCISVWFYILLFKHHHGDDTTITLPFWGVVEDLSRLKFAIAMGIASFIGVFAASLFF